MWGGFGKGEWEGTGEVVIPPHSAGQRERRRKKGFLKKVLLYLKNECPFGIFQVVS